MEEETIMRGESEAEGHTQMVDKIRHLASDWSHDKRHVIPFRVTVYWVGQPLVPKVL